jgi:hypothetical protein
MHRVVAVAILGLIAACPGPGTRSVTPGGGTSGGSGRPGGGGSGTGAGTGQPTPGVIATSCPSPGCVFHGGIIGGAYFTCLSSGAGSCFHFGARCAPADGCMYDAGSGTYRECAAPVEGTCPQYGAACQPASACAWNPSDGLHHTCEAWSGGTCTRWGATCAP